MLYEFVKRNLWLTHKEKDIIDMYNFVEILIALKVSAHTLIKRFPDLMSNIHRNMITVSPKFDNIFLFDNEAVLIFTQQNPLTHILVTRK